MKLTFIDQLKKAYTDTKLLCGNDTREEWEIDNIYPNLAIVDKEKINEAGVGKSEDSVVLEKLFSEGKKVVVVSGGLGSGKSTLCRRIARHWAGQGRWSQFDLIIILHLKTLNKEEYPNIKTCSEYEILANQVEVDRSADEMRSHIEAIGKDKTLLILDDLDELSKEGEEYVFKKLVEKFPNLLITSKEHTNLNLKDYTAVEIRGFKRKQICSYIKNFFDPSSRSDPDALERITTLENFIFSDRPEEVIPLAEVPLTLNLLCMLHDQKPFTENNSITITDVYQKSLNLFYKRYLKHLGQESKSGIERIRYPELRPEIQKFHKSMEEMAYQAMENQQTDIPRKEIESNKKELSQLGLLKIGNEKGVFIHKSFQDFFAAKHIARLYIEGSRGSYIYGRHYRERNILLKHGDDPNFLLVMSMTAGLLSQEKDSNGLELFFQHLCHCMKRTRKGKNATKELAKTIRYSLNECIKFPEDPTSVSKFFSNHTSEITESFQYAVCENQMRALTWLLENYSRRLEQKVNNPSSMKGSREPSRKGVDTLGVTLFRSAASNGNIQAMELLLEKDPGLLSRPDSAGWTSLHFAAEAEQVEVMNFLIKKDPQLLSKPDNEGRTPLHFATAKGNVEAMDLLLEKDSELLSKRRQGWTQTP